MMKGSQSLSSSPRLPYTQLRGDNSSAMKPATIVNKIQIPAQKIAITPFRSKQVSKGAKPPLFSSKSAAEIKASVQRAKCQPSLGGGKENLKKLDVREETKPESPIQGQLSKDELTNLLIEIKEVQDTGFTQTSVEENSPAHQVLHSIAAETQSLGEESVIKEIPDSIANKIPHSKISATPSAELKFRSHTEENLVSTFDHHLPHTQTEPKDTIDIGKKFTFNQEPIPSPRSLGKLAFSNCQLIKPHRSTKPSFNQICSLVRQNSVQKLRSFFQTDPKYFRKMLNQKEEYTGNKLLHIATLESNFDMCDLLLSIGAHVKDKVAEFPKKTAMHLAAEQGQIPLFSLYLTKDPDTINSQDEEGNTPLHSAAYSKNIHILDFVLTQCQSFDQTRIIIKENRKGFLPQDIVRKCGNSVQIHSVAQNLEKLKSQGKNPKMKQIEIQETTATSIDRVLGHLLK